MDSRGETSQREIQRAEKKSGRAKRKRAFPSVAEEPFDLQKYVEKRERNSIYQKGVAMRIENTQPGVTPDEAPQFVSEQWADPKTAEWALPLDDERGAVEPSQSLSVDFSTKTGHKPLLGVQSAAAVEEPPPWEAVRDKRRKATKTAKTLTNTRLLSFADDGA